MNDTQFLAFFDLTRPSMREAKSLLDSGKSHEAALTAARNASEGPPKGVISYADIAATRAAIQKHFPRSIDLDAQTAELWLRPQIPPVEEMGFADNMRRGVRARTGRKRGNDVLAFALLYATTGERKWAEAGIRAGVAKAANIHPLPFAPGANPDASITETAAEAEATKYAAYAWHPHSEAHLSHDTAHQLQYWLQAWPLLHDAMNDEDRLAWMKGIVLAARDMLRANRYEIPFNLTLHPLLPCMMAAAAYPALRESTEWIRIVADRYERDFCTPPFCNDDGYTGEGTGYHNVNTRLLTLGHLMFLRALGRPSPAVEKACRNAYAIQSLFLCPDGSPWMLGDSMLITPHEHWQDGHESVHLGAALFNRPEWKALGGSRAGFQPELLNLWLMGSEGIARWVSWPDTDLTKRTFANMHAPLSCFHALRAGEGVDAPTGILCFGMEHNHAHHDKGQVLIYGLGRHLLSDHGHPGYGHGDMNPGYSVKVHGSAAPIRRSPMGPRTDYPDQAKSLGVFEDAHASIALAEHSYFENHIIQRALALITPWGNKGKDGNDAFWLIWDKLSWKRGWPKGSNEPFEMIDTVFPLNAPGCGAKISSDKRTVWSQYDGPDGPPFVQRGPNRAELREGNELSDSDANIQITRLDTKSSGASVDVTLNPGTTIASGAPAAVPRPLAVYRWRGKLPHVSAYALIPFRGIREELFANVSGECDADGIRAEVELPRGRVFVVVSGISSGAMKVAVRV